MGISSLTLGSKITVLAKASTNSAVSHSQYVSLGRLNEDMCVIWETEAAPISTVMATYFWICILGVRKNCIWAVKIKVKQST
jgi:hypothetical protein